MRGHGDGGAIASLGHNADFSAGLELRPWIAVLASASVSTRAVIIEIDRLVSPLFPTKVCWRSIGQLVFARTARQRGRQSGDRNAPGTD